MELPPTDPATAWSSAAPAWSCRQQIPLQRGARRLQRGAAPSRPRYSVELGGSSVELPPADPATAWSLAAPAWSCPRQIPLQRGAWRPQRGAAANRSRHSVELGGSSVELPAKNPLQRGAARLQRGVPGKKPRYSVEFGGFSVELPPADPATAWSSAASAWSSRQKTPPQRGARRLQRGAAPADPATAWSSAPPAWSCRQQIPLQRGARRPQRGVPGKKPHHSVELQRASAWSCPQQIPLQRGAARLQRGAAATPGRSRYSVELGGPSVELPAKDPATAWSFLGVELGPGGLSARPSVELPADPATAWSSAAPAWSCRQKPRYSVELGAPSVELPPTDPATAWSLAPPAWSCRQQIPLQRGVRRLPAWSCPRQIPLQRGAWRPQRGAAGKKPRHSVELGGPSVELPPTDPATAWSSAASAWSCRTDPATAWSSAAPAWSCRQKTPLQRGAWRPQRGAAANRSRYSVELGGPSVELPPTDPATAWSSATSAWSCPRQTPLQRGARRLQRGAARPQRGVHAFRRRRTAEPSRLIRSALCTIMVHHGANGPPRRRAGGTSAGAQAARLGLLRARGLRRTRQDRRRKARLARLGGPGRGSGLHLPPGPPLPAAPAHPVRPENPGMSLAAPARFLPPGGVRFWRARPGESAS